jgi:hypothetical protein
MVSNLHKYRRRGSTFLLLDIYPPPNIYRQNQKHQNRRRLVSHQEAKPFPIGTGDPEHQTYNHVRGILFVISEN